MKFFTSVGEHGLSYSNSSRGCVVCAGVRQLLAITIQPILMFARLNASISLYLYRTSHKHDGLVFPVSACL